MVRMTDLLKKAKRQIGEPRPAGPTPDEEVSPESPTAKKQRRPDPKLDPPAEKRVEFSEALLNREKERPSVSGDMAARFMRPAVPSEEVAKKIYFDAVASMKKIFDAYGEDGKIDEEEIMDLADKIVNNILMGSRVLLNLFHELDSPELYLYHNAVNVSILSVEIGIATNYNKSTLIDLAVIGLLHDMDLIKSKHIVDKPEKLDEEELKQIKDHALKTATFVDNAFNFTKEIVNAILQHHERKEGQGYPAGLTDIKIQDLAEIVGIADTYESMTHSRPYKEKMSPQAAVLKIIKSYGNLFPNELIKALVSRVGLYPVGSWVQLNTGEICKVLEVNPDFPLRPVVSIIMDRDKRKFREVRTIDLQKIASLYIKAAIEEIGT